MTKRSVWKIFLLGILVACTVTGLVLLHRSSGGGTAATEAYAAEASVEQEGISYTLSDDGNYYIVNGFTADATTEQKTTVVIPDAIGDIPVTDIAESAFSSKTAITSLTIGANVVTYGHACFSGLTNLENLYYNCTVEYDSTNPGSITSTTYIFSSMGTATENGTTITISAKTTSIPAYLFCPTSQATGAKIADVIFEDNTNFNFIGNEAFKNVATFTGQVHITDLDAWFNITFVSDSSNPVAFSKNLYVNGEPIKDVVVPESVTEIHSFVLRYEQNIESLYIHKDVTSIGNGAFYSCASLSYIYYDAAICDTPKGYVFYTTGSSTDGITLVIGKDVQKIPDTYMFAYMKSGKGNDTLIFEEGSCLKEIGEKGFQNSDFASATIPGTVQSIGYFAFKSTGVTEDTFVLENPYDWYTTNDTSVIYDPSEAAAKVLEQTNNGSKNAYNAKTVENLRAFVDETSDAENFRVSLWWFERYDWTAAISGTTLKGDTVSGIYANGQAITEHGEYAITMTNSTGTETLTYYINIQDAITTPATCTADGLEQYLVSYTVNGETYDLDTVDITLPATGHTYSTTPAWTWTPSGTTYTATATFPCTAGDAEEVATATVAKSDNGTTYTATATYDGTLYTDTLHVHSYSITSTAWAEDGSTYTITLTCAGSSGTACDAGTVTEYAVVTSVTTPATCTEDGYTVYTATYNGEVMDTKTIVDTGSATGHSYGKPIWSWTKDEETGTFSATATFYCTALDDVKTIDATITSEATDFATVYTATVTGPDNETYTSTESVDHLFNVDWTWTATTDENGKVTGYTVTLTLTCQICNKSFEHTSESGDVTVTQKYHSDATCTANGYTRYEATFILGSGDEAVTYSENKTDTETALGHDYSSQVIAATCTEDGYTLYTCSRCGDTYTDTPTNALGHNYQYSSAEWDWDETYSIAKVEITCSQCGDVITEYIQSTYAVTTEPTCTETGVGTYTATYTYGDEDSITDTKTVDIPANGHTYVAAEEFSWTGDVTNGYTAATLTFTCSVCQDAVTEDATLFMSEDGTTCTARVVFEGTVYRESKHVHVYEITGTEWSDEGESKSCTITYTCIGSGCSDSYTKEATVTSETTEATCTEDGQILYTATYEGEVVATTTTAIEKTGHSYGEPDWVWTKAEDGKYTATATFFCEKGDDKQVITADITPETDESGTTYIATVTDPNDNSKTYTATTNVEHILDAAWTWTATTDEDGKVTGYTVTLTLTCQICSNTFEHTSTDGDVTVSEVYHRDAACGVTGVTRYEATYVYKAEDEADLTYTDTKVDTEDALEHNYESEVTEATCLEGGYTTHTCSLCGDYYVDTYTDALGHSYDYTNPAWTWSGTSMAEAVVTCTRCNEDLHSEYIDSTSEITTPATCTEDGTLTYTVTWQYGDTAADSITDSVTETIPATGHFFGTEGVWSWEEDTVNGGYTATLTFTCSVCSVTQPETADVLLGDNGTTYYATVIFEGKEYTESYHVHAYEITNAEWSDTGDGKACTITFTCMGADCTDSHTAEADVTSDTTEATCTEDGFILYTATYDGETVSTTTTTIEKTGHTYGDPSWSWDTDDEGNLSVTAIFQCEAWDDEQVISATVTYESSAFATTYYATVTAPDGDTVYSKERTVAHVFNVDWEWSEENGHSATVTLTCQICGRYYTYDATVTEISSREAACEVTGYTLYQAVYVHGEGDEAVTYSKLHADTTEALQHEYDFVTTDPTCTEKGYTTYTCKLCGKTYIDENSYTDAKGHTYTSGSVEWVWAGTSAAELIITCDVCGEEVVMEYVVATDTVTTPATCTTDGLKTFTVTYTGTSSGETITDTKTEVIPATGHTYEKAEAFEWAEDYSSATLTFTCTSSDDTQTIDAEVVLGDNGTTYTATVTFEGETYTESKHVHVYEVTDAKWNDDHTTCTLTLTCVGTSCEDPTTTAQAEVDSETTEPTCTEAGETVYTATYNGVVVSTDSVEIEATGHSYEEPEWSWSKDEEGNYSATATFICEHGDDKQVVEATVTSNGQDSNGDNIYKATVTFEGQTYTDSTTDHEHLYNITWTWSEDGTSASITFYCYVCEDEATYEAEVTRVEHLAAACEEDGYSIFEAIYTSDDVTYEDVFTLTLDATGHSYAANIVDPTCVDEGFTLYRCRLCGDVYHTDTTEATGIHTDVLTEYEVNESAKEVHAYTYCSECGMDVTDDCCIIVTDYYGNTYTIAFVNGVADYSSVAYPVSISISCTDGTSTKVDITPVEPDEPAPTPTPEEPAEEPGGLAGWAIALIVIACVIVVAAIVLVILLMLRKKKAAKGDSADKKE